MFSLSSNKTDFKALKKVVGSLAAVVLGMAVAFTTPPDGLTPQAMWTFGIILWAVTMWMFEVAPDYVVAMAMCTLWVLFKCAPFKTAFASFSDTSWWLLLGALGMGTAVSKSGLLKRLSLQMMTLFPATFNGQVLALICGGTLIAPLIPSVTAKAAIMAPISLGISDAMGYARKSRGAAGLFAAMGLGFILTGPMFISASFIGFMLRGLLPADIQTQFNWTWWFAAAAVWSTVMLVLMYIAIRCLYTPDGKYTARTDNPTAQLAKLGPMSSREKTTSAVLLSALILWMTEPLHGIHATAVALLGLVVLLASGIFDRTDFRSEVGWDSLIFIGGIINLGNIIPALNIDKWIVGVFNPMITPMMSNLYLFTIVLALAIYAVRFLLVSFTATTAIFTVVLIPFAIQAGINPWVTGFIVYVSTNIWLVFYQNSTFVTAYYAVGGEMVTHRQIAPFSAVYCMVSLLALLLSVPLWRCLGLVP